MLNLAKVQNTAGKKSAARLSPKHSLRNFSAILEERADFFSVRYQPVHERMKVLGTARKKLFLAKRDEEKEMNFLRKQRRRKSSILFMLMNRA